MNAETAWTRVGRLGLLLILVAALGGIIYDPVRYTLVVAHLTLIPAICYPLVYLHSPWKTGPTGKALMNKARAVALLYSIGLLGFWWPFTGFEHIYAIVVTYLGGAITYQFGVMLLLKRRSRIQDDPEVQP